MSKKNHPVTIKLDEELMKLVDEVLGKISKETMLPFKRNLTQSDLLRTIIKRGLLEIKAGVLKGEELIYG